MLEKDEFQKILNVLTHSIESGQSTERFAQELGQTKGISGYTYHTVPVVLHCWLSNQGQFENAITEIIRCGGDTDTTAAIVGGIMGAGMNQNEFPKSWINHIWEWPRGLSWIERLSVQLTEVIQTGIAQKPCKSSFIPVLLRNQVFLVIIILHVFRRLIPWP